MIVQHYLIYSKKAAEDVKRMGISDLAMFRLTREHTGGREFKIFARLRTFRLRRNKKNREEGVLNNVYIMRDDDEILKRMANHNAVVQDLNPSRIVMVRMNTRDKSISTRVIFNKEEPWEVI